MGSTMCLPEAESSTFRCKHGPTHRPKETTKERAQKASFLPFTQSLRALIRRLFSISRSSLDHRFLSSRRGYFYSYFKYSLVAYFVLFLQGHF